MRGCVREYGTPRWSTTRPGSPGCRATGLTGLSPTVSEHTAASLAVQAGANVKHAQQMLGHTSAAMTLDVYSGLFEDDLDVLGWISSRRAQPALVCPQCAPSNQQHLPRQAHNGLTSQDAWAPWDSNPQPAG